MDQTNLPLLIGLEVTVLLNLVLAGGLWFCLRELKRARIRGMTLRREAAKWKRELALKKPSADGETLSADEFLKQSIKQNQSFYQEQFEESDIADLNAQTPGPAKLLAFRHQFLSKELQLRQLHEGELPLNELTEQLLPLLTDFGPTVSEPVESASAPTPISSGSSDLEGQLNHYKQLYDDLLVTLQRSKDTIKSLALRLSDIIDTGMDEDQLNALVEELNNSMDAFGELSGISSDSGTSQLEDEVKEIRKAYEMGMNLMEHFEHSINHTASVMQSIKEHTQLVESNRMNYEEGETLDRNSVLANNKRYSRILSDADTLCETLQKELDNGKAIIGNFLAMTRKFQDQSTRIVILQSREKQLNSDLKQMKQSQHEALLHLKARDVQLDALNKKYILNQESEALEKLIDFAKQIHEVEQEIAELDQQEVTTSSRKQRQQLVQKRMGLEILVRKEVGLEE